MGGGAYGRKKKTGGKGEKHDGPREGREEKGKGFAERKDNSDGMQGEVWGRLARSLGAWGRNARRKGLLPDSVVRETREWERSFLI